MDNDLFDLAVQKVSEDFIRLGSVEKMTRVLGVAELDAATLDLEEYFKAIKARMGRHAPDILRSHVQDLLEIDLLVGLVDRRRAHGLADLAKHHPWIQAMVGAEIRAMLERPSWKFTVVAMRLIAQTHEGPNSLGERLIGDLGSGRLCGTLAKMLEPWRLMSGSAISFLLEDPGTRKDLAGMWQLLAQHPGNTDERWIALGRVLEIVDRLPELEAAVNDTNVHLFPLLVQVGEDTQAHALVKRVLLEKSVGVRSAPHPTPRARSI